MNIRARFEEIWPVPEGVYWSPVFGAYVCAHGSPVNIECMELNLRLDTFTRCQETTDVYVSLVDELLAALDNAETFIYNIDAPTTGCGYDLLLDWCDNERYDLVDRAKQIMEQKK